eukprot:scaffold44275_cov621-Skeletonema_marinoi.AAC.1
MYLVLARCFNTSETRMRESLHGRMSSLQKIQTSFLTSNGLVNKDFNGANTLEELQKSNDFQILFTEEILAFMTAKLIRRSYSQVVTC